VFFEEEKNVLEAENKKKEAVDHTRHNTHTHNTRATMTTIATTTTTPRWVGKG